MLEEAKRLKTEVHWEFSQKCEAWQLPEIVELISRHKLEKVNCAGCAVGLRTKDQKKLLCKAWTIATKNSHLLQHMNLQCQKNHPKGKCEAGETAHTARYTTVFAKKVVDSLSMSEVWSQTVQELQSHLPEDLALPAEAAPESESTVLSQQEKAEVERKIQHIHRSSGHCDMKSIVRALERRGSHKEIVDIAKTWKCPTCADRKRQDPRRFVTLEGIPNKGEVMEMDITTFMHPVHKKKADILLMVDVGSRFTVGRVLPRGNWEEIQKSLEELWIPYFGKPKTIRVDPAGVFLNKQCDSYLADKDIFLEVIPGEAHWKLGIVEQTGKTIKGMMEAVGDDFPDAQEGTLLAQCLWVANCRELYRGFSPMQYVMGRSPDPTTRTFHDDRELPLHPQLMLDNGFQEETQLRQTAEKAFLDEQNKRRLDRAERMGHRAYKHFVPGDLVYYWRNQLPPEDRTSFKKGRFLGPARVLATETRNDDGVLRPGGTVWIFRGGKLLRAAPEQLRHASQTETWIEELRQPVELPWTITSLCQTATKKIFDDITGECPTEAEWQQILENGDDEMVGDSQYEEREVLAPRRRHDEKKPLNEQEAKRQKVLVKKGTKRQELSEEASGSRKKEKSETNLIAYYANVAKRQTIEIEIDIPDSHRQWKLFQRSPEAFIASKLKRKQVEVREKTLTSEELIQFSKAKNNEVKNFISAQCFRAAADIIPNESEVVGMRWLLTWKYDPKYEGGRKAKARAIILGYQDPNYEQHKTAAPTPSKAGRQLFFQLCAWKKFHIMKGDVSGAFLQGQDMEEAIWCRPVKEICQEMGVADDTPMLLTKAAYGLVQAPLQWYRSVCTTMESLGYRRLITEPCCWVYVDEQQEVQSIIHGHVDDFVFGGHKNNPVHKRLMEALRQSFSWGTWEEQQFEQCGILVTQHEDFSITLNQQRFIEEIEEIHINRDRARQPQLAASDSEKSCLRGVLGSISWLCGQTCFLFSVDTNFLISEIPVATVETINKTNALVRSVKKWKHQEYKIHSFDKEAQLYMVAWADAAWANRPNGKDSTAGVFIGMSDEGLAEGLERNISPIHWRSSKIERVCRSPACAETLANTEAEDDLLYLRVLWSEMCGQPLDPRLPNEAARYIPALQITDSRNLYDKVHRPTVVVKGAEKRADIEAISLRDNLEECNTKLMWVHGGAMIANSLTKCSEKHQAVMYTTLGFRFRITCEGDGKSEKVRRREGLNPLDHACTTYSEGLVSDRSWKDC